MGLVDSYWSYVKETLAEYTKSAQALFRHRRLEIELGRPFLQYDNYAEASLLPQHCEQVCYCYTVLHTCP